jgi:hypothetical protein
MHSNKKMGAISTIRKPVTDLQSLNVANSGVAGGTSSNLTNKNNYKYMSPYAKNLKKD